jgi:hypothetical protein
LSDYLAILAAAALNAGCQINSTGTPAVSGAYAIDSFSWQKMTATALYIQISGRFPASQTTWTILDMNGVHRTFPTTASFLAAVTAIADYIAQIYMLIDGIGTATALPAQPINIA